MAQNVREKRGQSGNLGCVNDPTQMEEKPNVLDVHIVHQLIFTPLVGSEIHPGGQKLYL